MLVPSLNKFIYTNSNTTLVKVKFICISAVYPVKSNSNTTLVKVKFVKKSNKILLD